VIKSRNSGGSATGEHINVTGPICSLDLLLLFPAVLGKVAMPASDR